MKKIAIHHPTQKEWIISETDRDYHTQFGRIPKEYLNKKKPCIFQNDKQESISIFPALPIDIFMRLKRKAQVILPKDAAMILAYTGANKESVVIDSGAGSGWMTCFLANYVKHVYCYDINKNHLETAKKNIKTLGLKNVTLEEYDIYQGLPVQADILHLDVPEPYRVLENAQEKMQSGAFIVCYSPSLTQSQQTILKAKELGLMVVYTFDVSITYWNIDTRKIRPQKDEIGPTGFFTILRVLKNQKHD